MLRRRPVGCDTVVVQGWATIAVYWDADYIIASFLNVDVRAREHAAGCTNGKIHRAPTTGYIVTTEVAQQVFPFNEHISHTFLRDIG